MDDRFEEALGGSLRARPAREKIIDDGLNARIELFGLRDFVHHADSLGARGVDAFAGLKQAAGLARTDGAQNVGSDGGRNQTEPNLGCCEDGGAGSNRNVAH